ncbi:related to secreted chorismate mutase [Melanopsichium pennsylvanicum]|uniref:chorismate mutase n=2 Tax=Melanopsichium pennsylvanicum TaxID=63383 RepID=A0AAJ5C2V8_9BASI|nr:chorismate mutase [Melanopsichium pennsylvanicum 4]SNX81961.1 related to secreted chorismate mutase [Melanopsichium pennsylvanicum]
MKFANILTLFVTISSASGISALSTPRDSPNDRLIRLRDQLQRYETPLIHTYLARASLGSSVDREFGQAHFLFDEIARAPKNQFRQPDEDVIDFLNTDSGSQFDRYRPFPPGTFYSTPVVLASDAVLDKPVVGKDIFPTGRRPQDQETVVQFVREKLQNLKKDSALDSAAPTLLDASLLQLVSARVLLGYEVGRAKFDMQKNSYCAYFATKPSKTEATKKIETDITDHKQEVKVLSRVHEKAEAFSQVFAQDPDYPQGTAEDALRLFQGYIIPITKAIEIETLLAQSAQCGGKLAFETPPVKSHI